MVPAPDARGAVGHAHHPACDAPRGRGARRTHRVHPRQNENFAVSVYWRGAP